MPDLLELANESRVALRVGRGGRVRRAVAVALGVGSPLLLSGCQAVVNSTSGAQVRVMQASPDAPGIDFYVNTNLLASNVGFGSVSSYVPIDPGTYTVFADTSGSKQVLASAKNTFQTGTQYTVLVGNVAANLQELVLMDQAQAAPTGQIALRILDQATRVGALDVYLVPAGQKFTAVTPLLTNVVFGNAATYVNVPTGTYTIVIVPTGTVPTGTTVATYTGALVTYSGGSATTVVLIDQQLVSTPGLQVIATTDYVSPTATL